MNTEEILNFSEVEKLSILLGAKHIEDDYSQVLSACKQIWKHIESNWSEEQTSIFNMAVLNYLQDALVHQSISALPNIISDGLEKLTPIIESVEEKYDVRFEY